MCGHSYHKNCVDLTLKGCPFCIYRYEWGYGSEMRHRKSFVVPPPPSEEEYFKDMKNARDGFEVNAEYIGKRLFSKPALEEEPVSPPVMDCVVFVTELTRSERRCYRRHSHRNASFVVSLLNRVVLFVSQELNNVVLFAIQGFNTQSLHKHHTLVIEQTPLISPPRRRNRPSGVSPLCISRPPRARRALPVPAAPAPPESGTR